MKSAYWFQCVLAPEIRDKPKQGKVVPLPTPISPLLSDERLKAAILLGFQLAEKAALSMLRQMKARGRLKGQGKTPPMATDPTPTTSPSAKSPSSSRKPAPRLLATDPDESTLDAIIQALEESLAKKSGKVVPIPTPIFPSPSAKSPSSSKKPAPKLPAEDPDDVTLDAAIRGLQEHLAEKRGKVVPLPATDPDDVVMDNTIRTLRKYLAEKSGKVVPIPTPLNKQRTD